MKRKIIFIIMLFVVTLHSATVQTNKESYLPQESIQISFIGMLGHAQDWIAIYPVGTNNDWGNVVKWNWTGGTVDGNLTFGNLPQGNYEVRAFFQNTYTVEATDAFIVEGSLLEANVTSNKSTYSSSEEVLITFSNMLGDAKDWIGIYPSGSTNDWANVVAWKYTAGLLDGNISFSNLPIGTYDTRAFFQNTFNLEANSSFTIANARDEVIEVNLTLNKSIYAQNELVYITYDKMQGNQTDWIGIYPAGSSDDFSNVIDWRYLNGTIQGEASLGGYPYGEQLIGFTPMPTLAQGDYEVRAFFNNSLHREQVAPFSVLDQNVTSTIYEDANGSISPNWIHVSGPYPPAYFNGIIRLRAKWTNSSTNTSEYTLPFNVANTTDKILEVDVGGAGRWTPHFNVGVLVQTTQGYRRMLWDSFMNHYNVPANKNGVVLAFPTYVELQRSTANSQKHLRVNIEKYLRILEPNNRLISVTAFFATGGDLDNIKLSSH